VASVADVSEFTDNTGRFISIGLSPDSLSDETFKALLAHFLKIGQSFTDKFKLAETNLTAITSLVLDLTLEIRADDLNKDIRWFDKNKKKTKLYRASQGLLKKTNKERRKEFARHYPMALKEALKMKDSNDQKSVMWILDKESVNVWNTWKSLYCDEFRKQDQTGVCK
jgi:hypothetical protein